jgi:hypothetical protein
MGRARERARLGVVRFGVDGPDCSLRILLKEESEALGLLAGVTVTPVSVSVSISVSISCAWTGAANDSSRKASPNTANRSAVVRSAASRNATDRNAKVVGVMRTSIT